MGKKNVAFLIATSVCAIQYGDKLSSFRLVMLLVSNKFRIDLLVSGQLPLVVSFEVLFLFVMSGTGFTLPNLYADAGDSKLSGRNVPIINDFSMILC